MGCQTVRPIQVVQPMDRHLTCDQLAVELSAVEMAIKNTRKNSATNSADVAALMLFWPALAVNGFQSASAQTAGYDRADHLRALMMDKHC